MMRFAAVVVLAIVAAGCDSSADPQLRLSDEIRYWSIPADGASIPAPRAIHVADEEVYVLDDAGRMLVYSLAGELVRQWRMPDYDVGKPEGLWRLQDGRIAVADTHYDRIVFFDTQGEVLGMMGSHGTEPGQFVYPVAITQDDDGFVYISEYGDRQRVQKFKPDGEFVLEFGGAGTKPGQFQRPSGLSWYNGRVYVVDAFNNRVQVFSDEGEFVEILGTANKSVELDYPYDIGRTSDGSLFIIEHRAGRLTRLDSDGRLIGRFGSSGRGEQQFLSPWGLAVVAESHVLVADTENRRIVEIKL